MKRIILMTTIAALVVFCSSIWCVAGTGDQEFSWQHQSTEEGAYPASPNYRGYYYNYPHDLPPDYVYRTGRVYGPSSASFNWRDPLAFFRGKGGSKRVSPRSGAMASGEMIDRGLPQRVEELALQLIASADEDFTDEYVLTVSTFVNLNDLYATSSLGRYLAEQCMAELQLRGARLVEVRKTPAMMIRQKGGEYGLSRDMDELSFVQGAQAMVAGTYTVSGERVFLNAKLLRNSDNRVLATASLSMNIDQEISQMLSDEKSSVKTVLRTSAIVPVRSFPKTSDMFRIEEE